MQLEEKEVVTSPSPTSMTQGGSFYPIAKWLCYLKAIWQRFHSFLLVVPWKVEKLHVSVCVNKEERVEKTSMTFCCVCYFRKHVLLQRDLTAC